MNFRYVIIPVVAACAVALASSSPVAAFTTQTMNNTNPDGSAKFADPDEQMPFGDVTDNANGTSPYTIKLPDLEAPSHNAESKAPTPGDPWEAWRKRLLFGPFKHFGYGNNPADR